MQDKLAADIKNELKNVNSDFSFSQELQNVSKNERWKRKYGLWTLLSASCDDAASKCYEYINRYIDELVDVDTCNIHSLKSIAKSVDLGFLCKNINENYPKDVLDLINLFSVPKHILLDTNRILKPESNDRIEGLFTKRINQNLNEYSKNIPIGILYDIKSNIMHIRNILNMNMIPTGRSIRKVFRIK